MFSGTEGKKPSVPKMNLLMAYAAQYPLLIFLICKIRNIRLFYPYHYFSSNSVSLLQGFSIRGVIAA